MTLLIIPAIQLTRVLLAGIAILASAHTAVAQDSPDFKKWKQAMVAQIAKAKIYPPQARANGVEGRVIVKFTVDRSGNVIDSSIDKTSCFAELDQEALAALQRAAPFRPFPADVQWPNVSFKLPFKFVWDLADPRPARRRTDANSCPQISRTWRARLS